MKRMLPVNGPQLLVVGAMAASIAPWTHGQDALLGAYTGSFTVSRGPKQLDFGMELAVTSVEQGAVKGKAKVFGGQCAGSYDMDGTFENNKLAMKGAGGPCPLSISATLQGNRLVGTTGAGGPLQLSK